MIELKKELNTLLKQIGKKERLMLCFRVLSPGNDSN
jgi:hypothetical protein